ncbi:SRPBCC family protein [Actinoplanes sp. DH11]|uniref:SRPBCC family protein n=1 Tax=Actinoplanes sp. DH11 TaxID=2857011 RepID=UPI001E5315F6|nr:SRPBCC family protein [Actinoplanes sp. DH11]
MIDVKEQISTVRRTLGTRVLEAGEARELTISQVYDTDLDDLWDVVTNPARIARWFLPVTGELREGGRYQLEGNAGGTVTACAKPRSYAATWEFGGGVSWIEVRLTPEDADRTRFDLTHIAHVDEHWEQYGPGAVGIGWDLGLIGLHRHVTAPGTPVDPAAVEAWSASPDGALFMRLSGEAWAEADIAAGEDPEQARTRSAATIAFYTGG